MIFSLWEDPILSWSAFWTDLDGWSSGKSAGGLDNVWWDGGNIAMDGSDFGIPDDQPNAWMFRQIGLPLNARSLRFDTWPNGPDSHLRVRLVDQAQVSHVIQMRTGASGRPPQSAGPQSAMPQWVDIGGFAGQTVTIFIERFGVGEIRWLDDAQIRSDSLPPPDL